MLAVLALCVLASTLLALGRRCPAVDARRWPPLRCLLTTKKPMQSCSTRRRTSTFNPPIRSRRQFAIAYKILRPSGRDYGIVAVSFNPHRKITGLRGWCIPAQGKDYEVKDKEAIEVALPKVAGSELISDVKDKLLQIPAADPGNVVGYEYEEEEQPLVLQDVWMFQREIPAGNATIPCSSPQVGNTRRPGSTIRR